MNNNLDRSELFVMRLLYESSAGLTPHTLMRRSNLSGETFMKVFTRLTSKKVLMEKQSLIILSDEGRSSFLENHAKIISGSKAWREVPKKMQGRKIFSDELYAPNINLMR